MVKDIYHGSEENIVIPTYGKGRKSNDYGQGFYCTENLDLSKEWAVKNGRDGYSHHYQIDLEGLSVLDLNAEGYCALHWLAVLLQNREFEISSPLSAEAKEYITQNFSVDYADADVMVGYRADDSYFTYAQNFLNNTISYRQLCRAMHLGNLGEQIVIKSPKAFKNIHFIDKEKVLQKEWYPVAKNRDEKARRDYFKDRQQKRQKGDLYVIQIIDEEIRADDMRLR